VPPPRIPADAAPIDTSAPLAPAANFIAPTQQSSLTPSDYSRSRSWSRATAMRSTRATARARTARHTPAYIRRTLRSQAPRARPARAARADSAPRSDYVRHYLTNHVIGTHARRRERQGVI
jgi:hypothetical protein